MKKYLGKWTLRHGPNKWMILFWVLFVFGIGQDYFVVTRWWAIRVAMNRGDHRLVWNLLGRGLTDPND